MGTKNNLKTGNIEIDTSLSIFNAATLHDKILEAYKKFDRINIDLKDITDCDSAGIQLLYSLKNSCLDTRKELVLTNPSDAVTDALKRMSMSWEHLSDR